MIDRNKTSGLQNSNNLFALPTSLLLQVIRVSTTDNMKIDVPSSKFSAHGWREQNIRAMELQQPFHSSYFSAPSSNLRVSTPHKMDVNVP